MDRPAATPAPDVPYFSSGVTMLPGLQKPRTSAREVPVQTSVRRLLVDARDRWDAANTSPFDFKVFFGNDPARSVGIAGYENVSSVELKAVAFPKVANERYVIMSVDELNDNMLEATSGAAHDAFAVVYFDGDGLATGAVKPLKGADFYLKQLAFAPSLSRLNSLSIKFLKHDGNVVTTADTANETHVSLLFEVTSKVPRGW